MNEETQQIEIDITGWWCVFWDGKPIALLPNNIGAHAYVNDCCDYRLDFDRYQIQQITRKVDFAKVNEALKVRGLV